MNIKYVDIHAPATLASIDPQIEISSTRISIKPTSFKHAGVEHMLEEQIFDYAKHSEPWHLTGWIAAQVKTEDVVLIVDEHGKDEPGFSFDKQSVYRPIHCLFNMTVPADKDLTQAEMTVRRVTKVIQEKNSMSDELRQELLDTVMAAKKAEEERKNAERNPRKRPPQTQGRSEAGQGGAQKAPRTQASTGEVSGKNIRQSEAGRERSTSSTSAPSGRVPRGVKK